MDKNQRITIVGAGLAGINLCWQFWFLGLQNLTLLDAQQRPSSSRVAAGMFNPVVFRRINPSWQVQHFLPFMVSHYKQIEQLTQANFLHFADTLRIFHDTEYANDWDLKQDEASLSPYLAKPSNLPEAIRAPYGVGLVKQSGYLNTAVFIETSLAYFSAKGIYNRVDFETGQLEDKDKSEVFVFCRGVQDAHDGPFSYLPFAPVKGEVLTLQSKHLSEAHILSKKHWVLPIGNYHFKLGATYNWRNPNWMPSDEGKGELLEKLHEMQQLDADNYQLEQHQAGVRPATRDRRPLIGAHPEMKNVFLFNGMGSKGVLMSPWLAKHFAEHLLMGSPLLKEVNIERYKSFYHE